MKEEKHLYLNPVRIQFDMNQLLRTGLTIEEFFLCYLIYKKKTIQLEKYETLIEKINKESVASSMILKGYCKLLSDRKRFKRFSDLMVTKSFIDIVGGKEEYVDDWIKDWMELWPKGAMSGGYYIRGSKIVARSKMRKFIREFPDFSKEIIFEATKRYVMRMATNDFKYSKLSHYFIYKDLDSPLAAECEACMNEDTGTIEEVEVYGESEL